MSGVALERVRAKTPRAGGSSVAAWEDESRGERDLRRRGCSHPARRGFAPGMARGVVAGEIRWVDAVLFEESAQIAAIFACDQSGTGYISMLLRHEARQIFPLELLDRQLLQRLECVPIRGGARARRQPQVIVLDAIRLAHVHGADHRVFEVARIARPRP